MKTRKLLITVLTLIIALMSFTACHQETGNPDGDQQEQQSVDSQDNGDSQQGNVSDSGQEDTAGQTTDAKQDEVKLDGSEKAAMDRLVEVLIEKKLMMEGFAVRSDGQDTVDGKKCWLFSWGENSDEKFTALDHYAVADDGTIYLMDILEGGEYLPFH